MSEQFISESIKPVVATADTAAMAAGGPGLPAVFHWRGQPLEICALLRSWREVGPCRHGSDERYVRKHWFEVRTIQNQRAKLYFERTPRGKILKDRWWLFSIDSHNTDHA